MHWLSQVSVQEHLFPLVIFFFALAIGIELTVGHFKVLLARPHIPVLGTLVHTVAFPLVVGVILGVVLFFGLNVEDYILLGIVLLASCPSGGFSNLLVLLARADIALSVLLTAVSSLISFVTVPFFFWLFAQFLPQLSGEVSLPVGQTLLSLLFMVVIPVGAGMAWRAKFPEYVVPRIRKIQNLGQISLYFVLLIMLIQDWDNLVGGVGPVMPWALGLCFVSLATGFFLSRLVGLGPADSATVAIESSIRNLAVAFLIATTVLDRVDIALLPSVYFMAVLIVGLGFARFWRVRMAPRYAARSISE